MSFQLDFDDFDTVSVKAGDKIGFMKINDSFPIPYVFNPLMSAELWYFSLNQQDFSPSVGDILSFEEMGFPYHFSITVKFKAVVKAKPSDIKLENKKNNKAQSTRIHNANELDTGPKVQKG